MTPTSLSKHHDRAATFATRPRRPSLPAFAITLALLGNASDSLAHDKAPAQQTPSAHAAPSESDAAPAQDAPGARDEQDTSGELPVHSPRTATSRSEKRARRDTSTKPKRRARRDRPTKPKRRARRDRSAESADVIDRKLDEAIERRLAGLDPLFDDIAGRCQNRDVWGACIPRTMHYEEGDPIPEGWRLRASSNDALIIAGAGVGITSYVLSTVAALLLDRRETEIPQRDGTVRTDVSFDDDHAALFIPVAGPFVTIAQADANGTGAALLALDGAVQLAAIAMIIGGAASTVTTLEEQPPALVVSPIAAPGQAGVMLSGSF